MPFVEQETLLSSLANQDTRNTTLYTRLLLSLPIGPVPFYIVFLLQRSTFLPAFLSIVSLLATAYALYYMPLPPVAADTTPTAAHPASSQKGKAILRDISGHRTTADLTHSTVASSPLSTYVSSEYMSLLHQYIIPMNGAICILLALYELYLNRSWREGMQIGGGYVPSFILGAIIVARRELRVVDLGGLERLRYRYKAV